MFTAAVLALRAYTTAAFASLNRPLRDLDRTDPHGFPATVSLIKEAIGKLRTVGAEGDDANRTVDFFRGMRNVQNSESFLQDGVTELGVARSSVRCGLSVFICSLGSRGSEQVLPRGEEGKLGPWCSDRCVCHLGHSDDVNDQRFGGSGALRKIALLAHIQAAHGKLHRARSELVLPVRFPCQEEFVYRELRAAHATTDVSQQTSAEITLPKGILHLKLTKHPTLASQHH